MGERGIRVHKEFEAQSVDIEEVYTEDGSHASRGSHGSGVELCELGAAGSGKAG